MAERCDEHKDSPLHEKEDLIEEIPPDYPQTIIAYSLL
jgi:hypothetical protein